MAAIGEQEGSWDYIKLFIIWSILILILWIGYWFGISKWIPNADERGLLGDMYGAFNALISGFAFVGIIISIRQQQKEIRLQINEQVETRREFEKQTNEFVNQVEVEEQKTRDSYMFELVRQIFEHEERIIVLSSDRSIHQQGWIDVMPTIRNHMAKISRDNQTTAENKRKLLLKDKAILPIKTASSLIRYLSQIDYYLKWVKGNCLNEEERASRKEFLERSLPLYFHKDIVENELHKLSPIDEMTHIQSYLDKT